MATIFAPRRAESWGKDSGWFLGGSFGHGQMWQVGGIISGHVGVLYVSHVIATLLQYYSFLSFSSFMSFCLNLPGLLFDLLGGFYPRVVS